MARAGCMRRCLIRCCGKWFILFLPPPLSRCSSAPLTVIEAAGVGKILNRFNSVRLERHAPLELIITLHSSGHEYHRCVPACCHHGCYPVRIMITYTCSSVLTPPSYRIGLAMFGSLVLITTTTPWIGLLIFGIVVTFAIVQYFYTKTSAQLRRLDLGSRTPLYNLLADTCANSIVGVSRVAN